MKFFALFCKKFQIFEKALNFNFIVWKNYIAKFLRVKKSIQIWIYYFTWKVSYKFFTVYVFCCVKNIFKYCLLLSLQSLKIFEIFKPFIVVIEALNTVKFLWSYWKLIHDIWLYIIKTRERASWTECFFNNVQRDRCWKWLISIHQLWNRKQYGCVYENVLRKFTNYMNILHGLASYVAVLLKIILALL